jgi:hypothetical protein
MMTGEMMVVVQPEVLKNETVVVPEVPPQPQK